MSVYLDHNATSPLCDASHRAMEPFLGPRFGNVSSVHVFGQAARAAVDRARRQVKELLGAEEGDLIFTGSGTEAVFTAVVGACRAREDRGRHVVLSAIEHPAGIDAGRFLAGEGWDVTWVRPTGEGVVEPEAVETALGGETVLVSVIHANNETGVIQPVEEIARICREHDVLFHTDAVQSVGKVAIGVAEWGPDLLSIAAHKMGGPQGVGALWRKPGVRFQPLIPGTQEGGARGGTVSVATVVGFGAAAEWARTRGEEYRNETGALRDRLETTLSEITPARVTAAGSNRLPNTTHLTFDPDVGEDLVPALDMEGYAVSSGSACKSGSEDPSHVLLAMGIEPGRARTAVRASFGAGNHAEEVDGFVGALERVLVSPARGGIS
jgi:cysteine desulfurase